MHCPKCRQPLAEGEQAYLCCADAAVQWQCDQCGKVSEGFAFPYGSCPLCGGKLAPLGAYAIAVVLVDHTLQVGVDVERAAANGGHQ